MDGQHPKMRRPDPGHLKPYIESFALDLHSISRSERTITIYSDALDLFAGWLRHHDGRSAFFCRAVSRGRG